MSAAPWPERDADTWTVRLQRHLGTSPMRYLTGIRVRQAQSLLRCSNLSIKEIAFMVGFLDQLHFSRVSRAQTGASPTAFRNQGD